MLNPNDNDRLTQVGPGTPMGELFRRFWTPAIVATELPEPDGAPLRIRLLGEDLVAWRNTDGSIGLMQNACPHRGASMFFGRNEENGLRCVYHGWKFDAEGVCVDMPNEPAESNFKHKIKAAAYAAAEWGGLIWAYMGPRDLQPELPQFEWCLVPESHRHVDRWQQDCSYMQALEGCIDTSHVSFLHRSLAPNPSITRRVVRPEGRADTSPMLTVQETDYGYAYGGRRNLTSGQFYWRITQWLLPYFTLIPAMEWPRGGHCYVPIDDEHVWAFAYQYDPTAPLPEDVLEMYRKGAASTAKKVPGTLRTLANRENDYLIDRAAQKTQSYSGIFGVRNQDIAMVESMGAIYDRTKEHLGTADLAIIAARRILLRMAAQLQAGVEPAAPRNAGAFRVRPLDVVDDEAELGRVIDKYRSEMYVAP